MFIVVKNSKINEHIKNSTTEILPGFSIILNQYNTGCIQIYKYTHIISMINLYYGMTWQDLINLREVVIIIIIKKLKIAL